MKISYNNTPLKILTEPITLDSFSIANDSEMKEDQRHVFGLKVLSALPNAIERCKKNVKYIADPFYVAYNKAKSKLIDAIGNEDFRETGCLLSHDQSGGYNLIMYDLLVKTPDEALDIKGFIIVFSTHKLLEKTQLTMAFSYDRDSVGEFMSTNARKQDVTANTVFCDIYLLLQFMRHCDVETKIVNAQKREHHKGEKYVNETDVKIEVVDSTWFTEIVRTEGFTVNGFFRLQPCGESRAKRKLIWVETFEKHGYHRKAKIQ